MCFCSTLNFVDETYTMVSYLSPKLSESHLSYRDLFYIPKENKVGYFTTYLPWLRGILLVSYVHLRISIFIEWWIKSKYKINFSIYSLWNQNVIGQQRLICGEDLKVLPYSQCIHVSSNNTTARVLNLKMTEWCFFCIKVETHPNKDGQGNSDSRMQTNTSARERSVLKLSALTT